LAISSLILFLVLFLIFVAGIIILQIFLSKKENKWAGLILPFTSFAISLLAFLGILVFTATTGTVTTIVNGEIVYEATRQLAPISATIGSAVYVFLMLNIPTVILLLIYAACRSRYNKKRSLEKMQVQDLE
jgi:hypothetical protein